MQTLITHLYYLHTGRWDFNQMVFILNWTVRLISDLITHAYSIWMSWRIYERYPRRSSATIKINMHMHMRQRVWGQALIIQPRLLARARSKELLDKISWFSFAKILMTIYCEITRKTIASSDSLSFFFFFPYKFFIYIKIWTLYTQCVYIYIRGRWEIFYK